LTRKIASSAKPKVSLVNNGDGTFSFRSKAGIIGTNITFKPGVEFEERTGDQGRCRSVITLNGNRMIHIQKGVLRIN
jgi:fatty acid-binding protein 7